MTVVPIHAAIERPIDWVLPAWRAIYGDIAVRAEYGAPDDFNVRHASTFAGPCFCVIAEPHKLRVAESGDGSLSFNCEHGTADHRVRDALELASTVEPVSSSDEYRSSWEPVP